MAKKTILIFFVLLTSLIWSNRARAWEAAHIKCRNPEAQKLADEEYRILVADQADSDMDKAIALMEKATSLEPANDMLWIEFSGNLWDRGDRLPKDTEARKKARIVYFDRGMEAAKKALSIRESAAAHFWYAANMASGGEMKGILTSVWMFPTLRKEMDRADALDPHYGRGATARFWSEVVARVPDNVIKMVGMKPEDAIDAIRNEIKRDPNYFENHIYLADYLNRAGKKKEALEQLEFVLSKDPNSYPIEAEHSNQRRSLVLAKERWKEFTGKEYPNK